MPNVHLIARLLESSRIVEATRGDVAPALANATRAWERVERQQYSSVLEQKALVQMVVDNVSAVLTALTAMEAAGNISLSADLNLKPNGETKGAIPEKL
jgi:hypothetical protein